MTREKAIRTASQLVALAVNEATTEAEARSAALSAAKLIDKYDLLCAPTRAQDDDDAPTFDPRKVAEAGAMVMEEIFKRAAKRRTRERR